MRPRKTPTEQPGPRPDNSDPIARLEADLDHLLASLFRSTDRIRGLRIGIRGRPPLKFRRLSEAMLVKAVKDVMRKRARGVADACNVLAKQARYRGVSPIALRQRYYRALKRM